MMEQTSQSFSSSCLPSAERDKKGDYETFGVLVSDIFEGSTHKESIARRFWEHNKGESTQRAVVIRVPQGLCVRT